MNKINEYREKSLLDAVNNASKKRIDYLNKNQYTNPNLLTVESMIEQEALLMHISKSIHENLLEIERLKSIKNKFNICEWLSIKFKKMRDNRL